MEVRDRIELPTHGFQSSALKLPKLFKSILHKYVSCNISFTLNDIAMRYRHFKNWLKSTKFLVSEAQIAAFISISP